MGHTAVSAKKTMNIDRFESNETKSSGNVTIKYQSQVETVVPSSLSLSLSL